jgi:glycerol-3-phosphate acyltransferase PlsX
MLKQFGIMTNVYLQNVCGIESPKIGLLNIGVEDTKGDELRLEAYKLLSESDLNFIGNVEARDMPKGICDAVITDGFTGNVALKIIEGTASTLFSMIKKVLYKSLPNKFAALVLKKDLYSLKSMMDSSEVGGALLLGAAKPVIKAHGSSKRLAIKNTVLQAVEYASFDISNKISEKLSSEEIKIGE